MIMTTTMMETLVWFGADLAEVDAPGGGTTAAALRLGGRRLSRTDAAAVHELVVARRRPRVCTAAADFRHQSVNTDFQRCHNTAFTLGRMSLDKSLDMSSDLRPNVKAL